MTECALIDLLVAEVRRLWSAHGSEVIGMETNAKIRWQGLPEDPYWLWEAFVASMATSGGAAYIKRLTFIRDRFKDATGIDPLSWPEISATAQPLRSGWLQVASNPNPRRKTDLFLEAFVDRYAKDGLSQVQAKLLQGTRSC